MSLKEAIHTSLMDNANQDKMVDSGLRIVLENQLSKR